MVKIENITLPDFPLLLAPMEDVSDPPFRAVCKDNGADLMYTEFISSEGLIRDAIKSRKKLDIFNLPFYTNMYLINVLIYLITYRTFYLDLARIFLRLRLSLRILFLRH